MYARGEYSGVDASRANRFGESYVEFRLTDGGEEFKVPPEEGPKVTLGCRLFPSLLLMMKVRRSWPLVD